MTIIEEKRRAMIERINKEQNKNNLFINITMEDIDKMIEKEEMANDNEIIKIGPVELTNKEARAIYLSDAHYLVTYSKIYDVKYSQAQKRYYGTVVFQTSKKGENYARRGRFYRYTAAEVNWLLGYYAVAN